MNIFIFRAVHFYKHFVQLASDNRIKKLFLITYTYRCNVLTGAFLFPFILMLILLGFPLMFMELAFGQFAALGPAAIFDRICPLFYGKLRVDRHQ